MLISFIISSLFNLINKIIPVPFNKNKIINNCIFTFVHKVYLEI